MILRRILDRMVPRIFGRSPKEGIETGQCSKTVLVTIIKKTKRQSYKCCQMILSSETSKRFLCPEAKLVDHRYRFRRQRLLQIEHKQIFVCVCVCAQRRRVCGVAHGSSLPSLVRRRRLFFLFSWRPLVFDGRLRRRQDHNRRGIQQSLSLQ